MFVLFYYHLLIYSIVFCMEREGKDVTHGHNDAVTSITWSLIYFTNLLETWHFIHIIWEGCCQG